jgi:hypothetical protein
VSGEESHFTTGPWVNLLPGVSPGATAQVPPQGVPIDARSQRVIFFVSAVKFADGSSWKADQKDVLNMR